MKALKILKDLVKNGWPKFYSSREYTLYINEVNEAIEELETLHSCNKCVYAIHCEETDEYSYNHKDQNCKDCYRSGWTDNYKKNTNKGLVK